MIHCLIWLFRLSDLLLESFQSTSISVAVCCDIVQASGINWEVSTVCFIIYFTGFAPKARCLGIAIWCALGHTSPWGPEDKATSGDQGDGLTVAPCRRHRTTDKDATEQPGSILLRGEPTRAEPLTWLRGSPRNPP